MSDADRQNKRLLSTKLWKLSYPTMIAVAMQSVYDLVDMAWVGQFSKEAIAGVTLFSTIYMLFTVLNEVAGASSVSMISQSYGRGNSERTQKISEQTISFKVVLAVITGVLLLLFLEPLLRFYTDDQATIRAALEYGRIRIFFLPLAFSSYSVNTIFRCTNDPQTPMIVMLISGMINLILDPVLMFEQIPYIGLPGFGLGVYGAGLATVISITASFLIGILILLSGKRDVTISLKGLLTLDLEIDRDLLLIGLPAGFQLFVRQGFNAILMKFVTLYGPTAIAVTGLGSKLMAFGFMPLFGFTMAGSAMIGQALGREDVEEARSLVGIASRTLLAVVALLVLPVFIFPTTFLGIFSQDASILSEGIPMVRYMSVAMVIAAFSFGIQIAFSGSGLNRPQLLATLISRWGVQLPAMLIMVLWLQLPLQYFWVSFILSELADLAVVMFFYRQGRWEQKRV